jgi:N-acetyl-gamma-glutamyl-phosphate reductase
LLPAGEAPNLNGIRGANDCHIGLNYDATTGMVTVWTAIDNLVKGAAGQAVQNMNLMLGLPETSGLIGIGLFP